MLDHTEIRNYVGKDSKPFVVTGATSHDWLTSKVWSCWSWHCKYGHAWILLLQFAAAVVFIRNIWCSFAVMGPNSAVFPCATNVTKMFSFSSQSWWLWQDLAWALRRWTDPERICPGHEEPRRQPLDKKIWRRRPHRMVPQVQILLCFNAFNLMARSDSSKTAFRAGGCQFLHSYSRPQCEPGVLFGWWDEENVGKGCEKCQCDHGCDGVICESTAIQYYPQVTASRVKLLLYCVRITFFS